MIHGPGCPVCVTPLEVIDKALEIAARPDVIFCSFGDMLRVPGSDRDLFRVKSEGGDVRVVYSPLDALTLARENPDREVVFFGIGFETTAPANAMTVYQARRLGVAQLLAAGVARARAAGDRRDHGVAELPGAGLPRRRARLQRDGDGRVPAARASATGCRSSSPGSSRWTSWRASAARWCSWRPAGTRWRTPTARAVPAEGNPAAKAMLEEVFEVTDRAWRGIGVIPRSGWRLAPAFAEFDAERRFAVQDIHTAESPVCRSGEVLQGLLKPHECAAFGRECTPRNPLGATMVSSEGACAAYHRYRRLELTRV